MPNLRIPTPIKSFLQFFNSEIAHDKKVVELDLISFQKVFHQYLQECIDQKVSGFKSIISDPLAIKAVDHTALILSSGGKRVRPYMFFLSYITANGLFEHDALQTSVALELFHAFALIHDDVIDRAHERHGIPTIHKYIAGETSKFKRGDKSHIGEAVAILCGDLLFSWSQSIIAKSGNLEVTSIYERMIDEVVAGQLLDVSLMLEYKVSAKTIERKNEFKTALYTFVNPMLMGGAFAHHHGYDAVFRKLGLVLGQAFQIQDDLLDVVGNHEKTGKDIFLDIEDGQHTLLTQHIFEKSSLRDREVLMSLFGKPVDEASRKVLTRLFESTGAIEHAKSTIQKLIDEARLVVTNSGFKEEHVVYWLKFVDQLSHRSR